MVSKGSKLAPATAKFYGEPTESISKLLEDEKDDAADHNLLEEEISDDEDNEDDEDEEDEEAEDLIENDGGADEE